jgi:hypothetical protein
MVKKVYLDVRGTGLGMHTWGAAYIPIGKGGGPHTVMNHLIELRIGVYTKHK